VCIINVHTNYLEKKEESKSLTVMVVVMAVMVAVVMVSMEQIVQYPSVVMIMMAVVCVINNGLHWWLSYILGIVLRNHGCITICVHRGWIVNSWWSISNGIRVGVGWVIGRWRDRWLPRHALNSE
jgi:hypothetical protein